MIEFKGQLGKYKIMKKLGSGGFGSVYLAEDTFLQSLRALKIPHRAGMKIEKSLQESMVQSKLLDHPYIVKLLTVDIINKNIVMVMEYVKGTDLEKVLDQKERLPIKHALKYFRQLLSALAFAHQNKIIHRDIRPSNILIDENDDIKVTDFGTSRLLGDKPFATTRIGSPPYMAPEQFEGRAVLASDIYSAGCLFYEMVTGLPPVVASNPVDIYKRAKTGDYLPLNKKNPTVSRELNWVIMKTLSPDPAARYKSIVQITTDLDKIEAKRSDNQSEISKIKKRIVARETRADYMCWNCRKTMPRKMASCLYCGAEQ
ncbi:MAG: serine/threonine protein kinase [Candidatus Aminicenantes bacterium]|nr:serine/threonine protein kinase [Candidatus Aminicenantes bacterium]